MSDIVKVNLSDHDAKRIKSLSNSNDYIVIRIKKDTIMFLVEGNSYFKAVQLKCTASWSGNLKVDSDTLVNLTSGGFLGILKQGDKLALTYSATEQAFDNGIFKRITTTPLQMIDDMTLREYLTVIKGVEGNMLYISELVDLKDILKVCTYNKIGIEISDGYIRSSSNIMKMFKPIADKDLSIGLDIDALKEIEKFGTDCRMHNVSNYLVLTRNEFMLAVRKCTLSNIRYPDSIYSADLATTCSAVNITELFELMKSYNKNLNKLSEGYVLFDLVDSRIQVYNGRTSFYSQTFSKQLKTSSGFVANKVKLPLANMHGLGILKGQDDLVIYTYGNIIRLALSNGISLIMKGEVA